MYASNTIIYLLNRIPSKVVPKILFQLWINRKPSLRHPHVWDCPIEVRVYNPLENKLDSQMVDGYFIGYLEKSKRHIFYYLDYSPKIVETNNANSMKMVKLMGVGNDRA